MEDTTQAHDVAVRADDVAPDGPVKVDTAMRRCAAMYLGATGRYKQEHDGRVTVFDSSHLIGLFARSAGL